MIVVSAGRRGRAVESECNRLWCSLWLSSTQMVPSMLSSNAIVLFFFAKVDSVFERDGFVIRISARRDPPALS
jgi:hypothetical protein